MEEVKLRAWDTETKEMSYDFLSKNWLRVAVESPYVKLMQYTGLKDIEQFNDPKELYTSDIVKMHQFLFDGTEHENEIIGVLEYDEELACVCLTRIQHDGIKKYMGYDDQQEFEMEKIPICTIIGLHETSWTYLGNIHQHPQLLRESEPT